MSHDAVRSALRGVAAGLLTPFDDEREIDHDALGRNARTLYDRGIRTFLAAANISEYHSLSQAERIDSVATSVDALPADATVLGGVGGSTKDAIDLVDGYDAADVDAMMIMPPDHTYRHERGLLEYFERLASAADAPIAPYVRGYEPSVEFLADLTRIDGVVGIKYAIEDVQKLARGVEAGADEVVWVDGLAEPWAPEFFLAGAEGFSAGVTNFEPRLGLALYDALVDGDWALANELRLASLPFMEFRSTTGEDNVFPAANSVPAVKKGLELAGLNGGSVREPIVELSDRDERRAETLYRQLQADLDRLL